MCGNLCILRGRSILGLIDRRIGPILASLDVSRSVERLATASSVLSAVTTEQERIRVFWTLSDGSSRLKQLLAELSDSGLRQRQLAAIEASATQLTANYIALDAGVRQRLQVIGAIKDQMRRAFDTREEIQRLLSPTPPIPDSEIDRPAVSPDEEQVHSPSDAQSLVAELSAERLERRVQQQVSDVMDPWHRRRWTIKSSTCSPWRSVCAAPCRKSTPAHEVSIRICRRCSFPRSTR